MTIKICLQNEYFDTLTDCFDVIDKKINVINLNNEFVEPLYKK